MMKTIIGSVQYFLSHLITVLMLFVLGVSSVWSVELTAVGAAAMGKDLSTSRDDAIRDALRQASLQVGGFIFF